MSFIKLKEWFGNSIVVDKHKNPLLVYRGEYYKKGSKYDKDNSWNRSSPFHSVRGALSFSDSEKIALVYASKDETDFEEKEYTDFEPRVYSAYLKIEKPFFNDPKDQFIELSMIRDKLGEKEAIRIAIKFSENIMFQSNWLDNYYDEFGDNSEIGKKNSVGNFIESHKDAKDALDKLYFQIYHLLDDLDEVVKLKKAGYDGAIHNGTQVSFDTVEYKVFSPDQILIQSVKKLKKNSFGKNNKQKIPLELKKLNISMNY